VTNDTSTYWFRPKRYGYGAEPTTWQGWAATGLFVLAVAAIAWFGLVAPALAEQEPSTREMLVVWGLLLAMTAAFVWLCHRKTDGRWRWRWGQDD